MEELIAKTLEYAIKGIKNSKTMQEVSKDFSEALDNEINVFWNWLKPIFITEFDSPTEQLVSNPDNPKAQGVIEYVLGEKLKKDEPFRLELLAHIEKLQQVESENLGKSTSNNLNIKGNNNITIQGTKTKGNIKIEYNTNQKPN